jgi:hypothetical protein
VIRRTAGTTLRFLLLAALVLAQAAAAADSGPQSAAPSGWVERSAGLFLSRPEIRLSGKDGGIAGEVELKPGTGILYRFGATSGQPPIGGLSLSVKADGCNLQSKDYHEGDASYVFSATAVFGEERQEIGWGKRVSRFFVRLWDGFPPSGIRLTYAWGCGAPVGSMFRIDDEETVFVVAGKDEAGKSIESKRTFSDDFQAAYGRLPKGPITGVGIRLERPSNEKGAVKASFEVKPTP